MNLRATQESGARWLAPRTRAYLADAPRVGKTLTLLRAAQLAGCERVLIFCPANALTYWRQQAGLLGVPLLGVYSYNAMTRGGTALRQVLLEQAPDLLLCDEAHRLRHADAQRTQLVLAPGGYARAVERVWFASGTPMPRHPGELWTILSSCFPAFCRYHGCRTYEQFLAKFVEGYVKRAWVKGQMRETFKATGYKDRAAFEALLGMTNDPATAGFMLRRKLEDLGADVPELDWQIRPIDLSHERFTDPATAKRVSEALEGGTLEALKDDEDVIALRRRLGALKAPAVAELAIEFLEENPDEKLVLFAYHRDVLQALQLALAEYGAVEYHGGTSPTLRERTLEAFQRGSARVFIGQILACQENLTLSAARHCWIVEPEWTAYANEQAGNRVMDMGTPGVRRVVTTFVVAETLDESITRAVAREGRMVREVF